MRIDYKLLSAASKTFGFPLSEAQAELLDGFFALVTEANEKFNLTALTDADSFTVKHLVDSLAGERFFPLNAKACDIGAGAGFPCVPLAVVRPDIDFIALDSTEKKIVFVNSAVRELGIDNVHGKCARAEDCSDLSASFDVVCARAVASLPVLLELSFPLLKKGGFFVAYKTDISEAETARNALKTLGGVLKDLFSFSLPNGDSRCIMCFEKQKDTPKAYPRRYSLIKKNPL